MSSSHSETHTGATVSALTILGFLAPVVRDVLLAPSAGPRLTEAEVAARLRECELCGVDDPAEPLVAMIHARRGRIAAHQDCGQGRGYELEVPAEPGVQLVLGNLSPGGTPARSVVVGGCVGSTLPGGHPAGTRSGVDAARTPSQGEPPRDDASPAPVPAPGTGAGPDVDDVRGCPVRVACDCCGTAEAEELDVVTADTPVGVVCLTVCPPCADAGAVPSFPSWLAAIRRVGEHAEHLGVTVDDLAPGAASGPPVRMLACPSCSSSNVADLGGWAECRECGHGFPR